jgi:type III pantothenate kinase
VRRAPLAGDLLAIDLGNSKALAVLYRGGVEQGRWRLAYAGLTPGRLLRLWRAALEAARALGAAGVPVLVESVAPARARPLVAALRAAGWRPHRVGWRDPWPFEIAVREPARVGVDRLCAVAGLMALGLGSGVAVDVGTAVTVDALQHGRFTGGQILPGFELAARSLHEHTALLPRVEVSGPVAALGRDTGAALRAGIYYGTLLGALGAATAVAAELGRRVPIVATGGGGGLLAAARPRRVRHVPDLPLLGMRLLATRLGVRQGPVRSRPRIAQQVIW